MSERTTPERPIHFGPRQLQSIPRPYINELQQVRSAYEKASLTELKDAMKTSEQDEDLSEVTSAAFELTNPITLNRLQPAEALQYIKDHGDHYRIPEDERMPLDALTQLPDGSYLVLVAGHRRTHAIDLLIEEYKMTPDQTSISSNVYDGVPFSSTILSQLRENVHERPPAQDEARAIDQLYRDITRKTGTPPSIGKFAALLPFSETKVREALAFATLPERVQNFTFDNVLSYSIVRRLKPLAEAYERLHAGMEPTARKQAVEDDLVVFCNGMLKMDLAGNVEERRARRIESHVREISGRADYQQESLFFLEQASPTSRRERSHRDVGALAAKILSSQIQRGELPEDAMDEIAALISEAKSIARARQSVAFDIFTQ